MGRLEPDLQVSESYSKPTRLKTINVNPTRTDKIVVYQIRPGRVQDKSGSPALLRDSTLKLKNGFIV